MNPNLALTSGSRLLRITRHLVPGIASLTAAWSAPIGIITGTGSYTQDFNVLPGSGTSNPWTDDATIAGWHAQRTGTGTTIAADVGTGTGGNLYSYGAAEATDRALGSIGSGNAAAGSFAYGVQLQNTSGSAITINSLAYVGEQWRKSGVTAPQTVTLWYKLGLSPITTLDPAGDSGWTAVPSGDFSSPVNTTTGTALYGNDPANRTAISIDPNINIPNGSYVMLRWNDPDHSGLDHGLAIDDVALGWTVNATPAITLSADPTTFEENAGAAAATGTVSISTPAVTDLVITLTSSDPTEAAVDASVTILAGHNTATFAVDAIDDADVDGTCNVTIQASATGYAAGSTVIQVSDSGDVSLPPTLGAGAIAFVGFNADGNDNLAFVALASIAAGDTILFTDNEWNGADIGAGGAFNTGEGVVTWAAPAGGVAAGTVVTLNALKSSPPNASLGTLTKTAGTLDLNVTGETVYAYQGASLVPTGFLAIIATQTTGATAGTGLSPSHMVYLPNDVDIAAYSGPRANRPGFAAYLAAIGTPTNWATEDGSGDQSLNAIAPEVPFDTTGFALASGSSYAAWAKDNANDEAAAADTDGDGVPNGIEYFMGEPHATFTPNPSVANGKITWPHNAGTSATFTVMTSTDLIHWQPATSGVKDLGTSIEFTLPDQPARIFVCLEVDTGP